MAPPLRKVLPSPFGLSPIGHPGGAQPPPTTAAESPSIHASISALGTVLSSNVPGSLQRATAARLEMRRIRGLG